MEFPRWYQNGWLQLAHEEVLGPGPFSVACCVPGSLFLVTAVICGVRWWIIELVSLSKKAGLRQSMVTVSFSVLCRSLNYFLWSSKRRYGSWYLKMKGPTSQVSSTGESNASTSSKSWPRSAATTCLHHCIMQSAYGNAVATATSRWLKFEYLIQGLDALIY